MQLLRLIQSLAGPEQAATNTAASSDERPSPGRSQRDRRAESASSPFRRAMHRYSYAVVLLCGLGAFALVHSGSRADTSAAPEDNSRIVDHAASLLDVPYGSSFAELRDFARARGRADVSKLVHLSASETSAFRPSTKPTNAGSGSTSMATGLQRQPLTPIPDDIEGARRIAYQGDALDSYHVRAILKTLDGDGSPWVVQEIRSRPGAPRVRMSERAPTGQWVPLPGWLEAGDSPARGWRVLAIDDQAIILVTPLGNLMRLPLASESPADPTSPGAQGAASPSGH